MRFNSNGGSGTAVAILPLRDTAMPVFDRRQGYRFKTTQVVEFCIPNQMMPAELVDLSDRGAKLRISAGVAPEIGGRVAIRLLDQTVLMGVTRWVDVENIGMQFLEATIRAEDHLHYDDLGQQMFSLILRQQRRLSASS
jgi:hypothetical protein